MRKSFIAAVAGSLLVAAAAFGLAAPAMASTACGANCTNATLAVGNTIGATGFPTSVSLSGQAGTTASAVATAYSIDSNTAWTLSWQADASDVLLAPPASNPAVWSIDSNPSGPVFNIAGSTTVTHNGNVFPLSGNGQAPVQIDSGTATAGGQNFTDTYSVSVPAAQAPGSYVAEFDYVLSAS